MFICFILCEFIQSRCTDDSANYLFLLNSACCHWPFCLYDTIVSGKQMSAQSTQSSIVFAILRLQKQPFVSLITSIIHTNQLRRAARRTSIIKTTPRGRVFIPLSYSAIGAGGMRSRAATVIGDRAPIWPLYSLCIYWRAAGIFAKHFWLMLRRMHEWDLTRRLCLGMFRV